MREFLKGLELDKETIDTIMAEYGKSVIEEIFAAFSQIFLILSSFDSFGFSGVFWICVWLLIFFLEFSSYNIGM